MHSVNRSLHHTQNTSPTGNFLLRPCRQLEEQRKLREVAEKHQKAEAEAAARRAAEEDRARIHAEREAQRRAAEDVKAKARVLAEAERRQAAVAARVSIWGTLGMLSE